MFYCVYFCFPQKQTEVRVRVGILVYFVYWRRERSVMLGEKREEEEWEREGVGGGEERKRRWGC